MGNIIKRLSPFMVLTAIIFLMIQIGSNLYLPILTANIINNGVLRGDIPYIWNEGFWMITLTVCSLTGALLNTFLTAKISYKLGSQLREEIYSKALQFSKVEFDEIGTASLITRNTNDVTQVQTSVEMGLKFLILAPLYLVGGIGLTWLLSKELALVFVATVPFLVLSAYIIYRFANPLYSKLQRLVDQLNLCFREGLTGVKVIRAFGKEAYEEARYDGINREYTTTSVRAGTLMGAFAPLITLVMSLATVVLVWAGGDLAQTGGMEIGTIIAAITYATQILLGFKILSITYSLVTQTIY